MKTIIKAVKGKKTYIMTGLGAVYLALISLGIAPNNELIWATIGGGTAASFRDALNHVKAV